MYPLIPFITRTTALLCLLCLGCQPSSPEISSEEFPADPDLPSPVVDLPSPPPASAFEIQSHNEDGSLRLEGLISNRDQYLEEEIQIRGVITKIAGNCNPRTARQRGESCPEPHFFIRDHADDDRQLLVVGFDNNFSRRARLREGQQYIFRGTYRNMSHGFVSTEDGLLVLDGVDDYEVP